jgi:hypothetical protein
MQTRHRTASLIILAAAAQRSMIMTVCLLILSGTANAQLIRSWPVDPMMTEVSERNILHQLGQIIVPPRDEIALNAFVKTLPPELPIAINTIALEGNGLSVDSLVVAPLQRPAPLFVHLHSILKTLECEIVLKHNTLTITTRDDADEHYPVRVYDVTPLTTQSRRYEIEQLQEVISYSLDPDSWETLGGMGTLYPQIMRNKTFLIIANSTSTHLQIDAFLNRLAGDQNYRSIPAFLAQPNMSEKSMEVMTPRRSQLENFANPIARQ